MPKTRSQAVARRTRSQTKASSNKLVDASSSAVRRHDAPCVGKNRRVSKRQTPSSSSQNTTQHQTCSVCMNQTKSVTKIDCTHVFHRNCIVRWLKSQRQGNRSVSCPLCRTAVTLIKTGRRRTKLVKLPGWAKLEVKPHEHLAALAARRDLFANVLRTVRSIRPAFTAADAATNAALAAVDAATIARDMSSPGYAAALVAADAARAASRAAMLDVRTALHAASAADAAAQNDAEDVQRQLQAATDAAAAVATAVASAQRNSERAIRFAEETIAAVENAMAPIGGGEAPAQAGTQARTRSQTRTPE